RRDRRGPPELQRSQLRRDPVRPSSAAGGPSGRNRRTHGRRGELSSVFAIQFLTARTRDADGWEHAEAELILGSYREVLKVDLVAWSLEQYIAQWRQAIQRLLNGHPHSRLLVSYRGRDAGYHFTWPIWLEDDKVIFQEQVILAERLPEPFDPDA